jgi:hypothetical protein
MQFLNSKVIKAAQLIDQEVLNQIVVNFYKIPFSELESLVIDKLTNVLHILNLELESLSEIFWNKSLEEPIEIEEALAAFLLNFITNFISHQINFKTILKQFARLINASFSKILKRVICSDELISFNISALLLFSQLKSFTTISSELPIFYSELSFTSDFIPLIEDFTNFLFRHSMFVEYFENLISSDYSEPVEVIIDRVLRRIVIVDAGSFTMYNVDGFTTYDRKIYLIEFETSTLELNKGATFYVLLHELCHFFRRVHCKTWRESMECTTPTIEVEGNTFAEAGDIFEVLFFGKRHNFLNLGTCEFLITSDGKLDKEKFKKKFIKRNKTRGPVSVALKRGNQISSSNDTNHVMLRGCAFRNKR